MDGNAQNIWTGFSGPNLAYLADLYDKFRIDPNAIDPELRAFFVRWGPPPALTQIAPAEEIVLAPTPAAANVAAAVQLSTAIRMYGYRAARLDPLGSEPPGDAELLPETHGLRQEDLAALPAAIVGGPASVGAPDALSAIQALRDIYEGTSGYEFEHVSNAEERLWLRAAVETGRFHPPRDPVDEHQLLERLTQVEMFERFLQSAFPTQTRFSLEGLDVLVPMLDEVVGAAAESEVQALMLGMAHRGRLNILAHVLGKSYQEIIAEFQGALQRPNVSACGSSDVGWTGDVKYHLGARKAVRNGSQVSMVVSLDPNPSHLEFVNPVVEGMTRAVSETRTQAGPARLNEAAALTVLIHGEAAFTGEGISAETLNLSRLPGYRTGGTIHLIANNQVGFTTPPAVGRSTLFASDLAKGFEIPIIHVNADDPVACIAAIRLAYACVERYHKDVVVDVIGYRRWGHNEGDEPSFSQPRMYQSISEHPTVRELWARELVRRGVVTPEEVEALVREAMARLQSARRSLPKEGLGPGPEADQAGLEAGGASGGLGHEEQAEIRTAVPAPILATLNEQLLTLPPGFKLHTKLEPFFSRRRAALSTPRDGADQSRIDFGQAEALAFATIVSDGTPIRLTGQDTARGTFSQRHLVLHDVATGDTFTPLQSLAWARASFDVWDSPLSEQATMGFEFGYDVQASDVLVLWEAQYGDFADVAQVMIDEFLVSARSKWGLCPSLVLLLPHGYEGQGPDHSSARIERFLQLVAEDNLRVASCTTAAQYFHILRRQAQLLQRDPRPLILLTPKSLLRHPLAASPLAELSEGHFQPVIDDQEARKDPAAARRLILCNGKVYIDLVTARQSAKSPPPDWIPTAIVRVEELYPFPAAEIASIVNSYPKLEEVAWVQEEPRNMGAWTFVAPRLRDLLAARLPLLYIGRTRRASQAEGSYEWHIREQKRLVEAALLRSHTVARSES
ncbi:MAG: 2-oxoglutarate dehydrogenase E1 component [Chloroflexota bacterium]|nr:MAG: 2-oxoglutarate dehydrogenase E1 component [Chloroflexota bacterium]